MNDNGNGKRVEIKTIVMSHDNLESAIVSFLYAMGVIPDSWDVIHTDLSLPLNEDGLVEFDMEVVKPMRPNLRVVGKNEPEDEQLVLPLEAFEKVYVPDI